MWHGPRLAIRPWNRRKDRVIANSWIEPRLPAHWSLVAPAGKRVSYAITVQGKLVGRLTLRNHTEIGIYLAPHERGKGYGQEAIRVFAENAGIAIRLEVASDNIRAIRCYQAAGLVAEGVVERDGWWYQQFVWRKLNG